MYLVSQPKPLMEGKLQAIVNIGELHFPPGYLQFLQCFGEGTYRGWMNVHLPDSEVLKPFPEYDLWEHDESSPITKLQIGQCIAIGTTVDGDFLAEHPETAQLLWLPRHEDALRALSIPMWEQEEEQYGKVIDDIYRQVYGGSQVGPVYYEPWTDTKEHLFLRLPPTQEQFTLSKLADMCREEFHPDLLIENEYTCMLFYQRLGGYIRFNLAYSQEIAIIYEQQAQPLFDAMEQWLLSKGCERYA